jgi:hypothetical protein
VTATVAAAPCKAAVHQAAPHPQATTRRDTTQRGINTHPAPHRTMPNASINAQQVPTPAVAAAAAAAAAVATSHQSSLITGQMHLTAASGNSARTCTGQVHRSTCHIPRSHAKLDPAKRLSLDTTFEQPAGHKHSSTHLKPAVMPPTATHKPALHFSTLLSSLLYLHLQAPPSFETASTAAQHTQLQGNPTCIHNTYYVAQHAPPYCVRMVLATQGCTLCEHLSAGNRSITESWQQINHPTTVSPKPPYPRPPRAIELLLQCRRHTPQCAHSLPNTKPRHGSPCIHEHQDLLLSSSRESTAHTTASCAAHTSVITLRVNKTPNRGATCPHLSHTPHLHDNHNLHTPLFTTPISLIPPYPTASNTTVLTLHS